MRTHSMRVLLLGVLLPTTALAVTCPGEERIAATSSPVEVQVQVQEQDAEADSAARPKWKTALRHVGGDARYLLTFPARVTRRGVRRTSMFGAGLAGLILLDQDIYLANRKKDRLESIRKVEQLGGFYETHLSLLALYGSGRLAHHEPTIETSKALMESLLFTDLFVSAGKKVFGRDQPDQGRAGDWFQSEDTGRFPSGHAARVFTLATVLAERHGKVAAWISYPLATLVGLSLVDSDKHAASDVFAGAGLGYVVGRAVVRRRQQRFSRRVRLEPVVLHQDGGVGVMVRIVIPQTSARRGR